eukprot:6419406-Prymnesium_polylepis.1
MAVLVILGGLGPGAIVDVIPRSDGHKGNQDRRGFDRRTGIRRRGRGAATRRVRTLSVAPVRKRRRGDSRGSRRAAQACDPRPPQGAGRRLDASPKAEPGRRLNTLEWLECLGC